MLKNNEAFSRDNNFNLIRIYLSISVIFFHCYELSAQPSLKFLNNLFDGDIAVRAFFIISGYLVMKSYNRSSSWGQFLVKRFQRVYPGYFVIVVMCAVLGCFITSFSWLDYFSSIDLYKFLAGNLIFLNFIQPTLPGVFENNAFTAVNGSLWTLKIEVGYYLLVPLIAGLRKKVDMHFLYAMLFVASIGYYLLMLRLYGSSNNNTYLFLSRQLPGQLFYFIIGAWIIELETQTWWKYFMKWMGIPCILLMFVPVPLLLQTVCLAVLIFFWAYIFPMVKYKYQEEDISYGLYIYHFPIIQLLVFWQVFQKSPIAGVLLSVTTTVCLAVLSWLLIEKPSVMKRMDRKLTFS